MNKEKEILIKANKIFKTIKKEYEAEISEKYLKSPEREEIDITDFTLSTERKENYQLRVETLLYAVAELSMSLTTLRDGIEQSYCDIYPDDKKEANRCFLKDYELLHKPYDNIKSKCWTMIFKLNDLDEDGLPLIKKHESKFNRR